MGAQLRRAGELADELADRASLQGFVVSSADGFDPDIYRFGLADARTAANGLYHGVYVEVHLKKNDAAAGVLKIGRCGRHANQGNEDLHGAVEVIGSLGDDVVLGGLWCALMTMTSRSSTFWNISLSTRGSVEEEQAEPLGDVEVDVLARSRSSTASWDPTSIG